MNRCCKTLIAVLVLLSLADHPGRAQQQPTIQFGGAYASLDARRQKLIDNWVERFVQTTGQKLAASAFYDDLVPLSSKTTFDAVTHALMTTSLTDRSGMAMGDALGLIDRLDSVRGEVTGASSDRQFRIYVRLSADAADRLERSREFKRGVDNVVYHKGYPINYRAQGGVPSLQFSLAQDRRHSDIDVDYRSPSFPVALFNGHLTQDNSDVRAGANFDRHVNRWSGFQSWWNGFFGVKRTGPEAVPDASTLTLPTVPRSGKSNIDVSVKDFLDAWLIEGDIVAAMGYVSERAYACLARDTDQVEFDRGLARFKLMVEMKAARDTLGPRASLEGLVLGTRLPTPALRLVRQPHHAQFVIYSVPDDVAATLDCGSQSSLGDPAGARRTYGNYFGATFVVAGQRDTPVAMLWARENGYLKIVSWRTGTDDGSTPSPPPPVAESKAARIQADPTLVQAARQFLDSWLVRKDYDAAFAYLSPRSYACYDLEKGATPASTSAEDAGRRIRAGLETGGKQFGTARSLDAVLAAANPAHPAVQVMTHSAERTIGLSRMPNALADAQECAARAAGASMPDPLPLEYGNGFSATVRFMTRGGDAPVLRMLWRREPAGWRITSYAIELP